MNRLFQETIKFCTSTYSIINEESATPNYLNWSLITDLSNNETSTSLKKVFNAFTYKNAFEIDSLPYIGKFNDYTGGGYVFNLSSNYDDAFNDLTVLREYKWIDRYTSAIFIEFSTYNPNINLFSTIKILFEFLPTGNIVITDEINTFGLYESNGDSASFKFACFIIFIIFTVVFMIREIILLTTLKKKYFTLFWSFFTWTIIGFTWTTFSFYILKIYASRNLEEKLNNNNIINMQYISSISEILRNMLGFCSALGTIRFLKLLRFNKQISYFSTVFKISLGEIFSLILIFLILLSSFAQLLYLILNNQSIKYATFIKSLTTLFLMMIGKFDMKIIFESNSILGEIIFILFNIIITFSITTVFITILNNAYQRARIEWICDKENQKFVSHIKFRIKSFLKKYTRSIVVKPDDFVSKTESEFYIKKVLTKLGVNINIYCTNFNV